MYEKMGLVNETDIDKYRKKIGIKLTVEDLLSKNDEEIAEIIQEAEARAETIAKGFKNNIRQSRQRKFDREEFIKILDSYRAQ